MPLIVLFIHDAVCYDGVECRVHLWTGSGHRNRVIGNEAIDDVVSFKKRDEPFDSGDTDRMSLNHLTLIAVVLAVDGDQYFNLLLLSQLVNHWGKHASCPTRGDPRLDTTLFELANRGVNTVRYVCFIFNIQRVVYIEKHQFDLP